MREEDDFLPDEGQDRRSNPVIPLSEQDQCMRTERSNSECPRQDNDADECPQQDNADGNVRSGDLATQPDHDWKASSDWQKPGGNDWKTRSDWQKPGGTNWKPDRDWQKPGNDWDGWKKSGDGSNTTGWKEERKSWQENNDCKEQRQDHGAPRQDGADKRFDSSSKGLSSNQLRLPDPAAMRESNICQDYAQGHCRNGMTCPLIHAERGPPSHAYGSMTRSNEICQQYLKYRCYHGNDCRFVHPADRPPQSSDYHTRKSRSRTPLRHPQPRSMEVCRNFTFGKCKQGVDCQYYHPPKCYDYLTGTCNKGIHCENLHISPFGEEKKKIEANRPCHAARKGNCTRGDSCKFSHDPEILHSSGGCYDFSVGKCGRGDNCMFNHSVPPMQLDKEKCKDGCYDNWFTGKCKRGSDCPWSHAKPPSRHEKGGAPDQPRGCLDFGLGDCKLGNACEFVHVGCNNYSNGTCNRGTSCRFVHFADGRIEAAARELDHNRKHELRVTSGDVPQPNDDAGSERGMQLVASGPTVPNLFANDWSEKSWMVQEARSKISVDANGQRLCFEFGKGTCKFGTNCKFSHESAMEDSPGGKGNPTSQFTCRDFIQGNCNYGSACRFSHVRPEEREGGSPRAYENGTRVCYDFHRTGKCIYDEYCKYPHVKAAEPIIRPIAKSVEPCNDYRKGKCERADKCRFRHIDDPLPPRLPPMPEPKPVNTGIAQPPPGTCYDYQMGRCYRDTCRFKHVYTDTQNFSQIEKAAPTQACPDFTRGGCIRGVLCTMTHIKKGSTSWVIPTQAQGGAYAVLNQVTLAAQQTQLNMAQKAQAQLETTMLQLQQLQQQAQSMPPPATSPPAAVQPPTPALEQPFV